MLFDDSAQVEKDVLIFPLNLEIPPEDTVIEAQQDDDCDTDQEIYNAGKQQCMSDLLELKKALDSYGQSEVTKKLSNYEFLKWQTEPNQFC